ncbi:type II toxin-antitoxin system YhaV family toxin [Endozoicomonas gorgoniicola]|uniref:Type II toxin-antitoxin system YhaV family toxin n=1 Tax=Endozoicomonas gorgoniicola TaxID=1234144 RepID=A0ABT3MUX3_9GAMM|nr:type II toxin-antitoxin system YhaV family toxin [Endozoicomonas gorgoniicola]MCW7553180.1 type II toxin-antitoxin system YhaV family toxin [Endozoicomonas gorgoniicola]
MECQVINGWTILFHPLFSDQVEALIQEVKTLKEKHPDTYRKKNATKRLAAIRKLAFTVIPEDPGRPEYRQGATLGIDYKHWFRAKFFQQYRLFFRFDLKSKLIIYVWVNDEKTKRAYNTKNDAYAVFEKMLSNGNPPDSLDQLIDEARSKNHQQLSDN